MHKNLEQHLPLLVEELSSRDNSEPLEKRWSSVVTKFFSEARHQLVQGHIDQCEITDDGTILNVPAIEKDLIHQLSIDKPWSFTTEDAQLTDSLLKLAHQFISVQEAIEQGASEERLRIARDLHDDVAARLLTLIHQVKDQQTIDLARSILKSLRNAIYTLDNKSTTSIQDAITDIRSELQDRLNTIGMQLFWSQPDKLDELHFTPRQHINLHRILHETVTNVIRHADAQFMNINIEIDNHQLHIFACDDGKGFNMDDCIPGKGINNIQNRVRELNGKVQWVNNNNNGNQGGSCLDIYFPITTKSSGLA